MKAKTGNSGDFEYERWVKRAKSEKSKKKTFLETMTEEHPIVLGIILIIIYGILLPTRLDPSVELSLVSILWTITHMVIAPILGIGLIIYGVIRFFRSTK
ncbi:MAG: hypothetical protein ACXAEU_15025 [Candidatus Hodarchaeales archaeon]|jgi:hypothetical protein